MRENKKQCNFRLPELTRNQLKFLAENVLHVSEAEALRIAINGYALSWEKGFPGLGVPMSKEDELRMKQ
jgi:predicted DNA-binding protein